MNNKEYLFTYEGLKKMEERLEYLKGSVRRDIAERIKQALAFGDISENSEYDEAKNDQARVEAEIARLEYKLKHAKLIDEDEVKTDVVSIGTTVKIFDMEFDEEVEYTIVGSEEANPAEQKISNESPVGRALMGLHVGDIAEVAAPDGVIKLKILEIKKM